MKSFTAHISLYIPAVLEVVIDETTSEIKSVRPLRPLILNTCSTIAPDPRDINCDADKINMLLIKAVMSNMLERVQNAKELSGTEPAELPVKKELLS